MPGGMFFGGLTQGFAQGFQRADEMKRRREQLKLEQQKLKLEEDTQREKLNQLRDIMTGRRQAADLFEQQATGATPGQPQIETETGDQPLGLQVEGQPGGPKPGHPMGLKDIFTKQAIMEGKFPEGLLKGDQSQRMMSVGVGGSVFDPNTNKEVYRNPTERTGVGAESQLFGQFMQQMRAEGVTDPEVVRQRWQGVLSGNAQARGYGSGSGSAQGRIDVQTQPGNVERQAGREAAISGARTAATMAEQPLPAGTADRMSVLKALMGTVGDIEKNFDPGYLGPIQGTDIAFEGRRRFGSMVNKPLGQGEVIFRQALQDAKDQILRARSGAQINEAEATRLSELLPKATDEGNVFRAGMLRFKNELGRMMSAREEFATTPRKNIGGGAISAPKQRLRFNPQTGQIE